MTTEEKYQFEVMLDGSWLATHPDGFAMKFSSQTEAQVYARRLAELIRNCELIVYGPSGEIEKHHAF